MKFIEFRNKLEPHFSAETACPGTDWNTPSAGHCAIVALLTQYKFGGELVSNITNGVSHWFNEIDGYYVDLTGDQFGYDKVRICPTEHFFDVKLRDLSEISQETLDRADKLAMKAGIKYERPTNLLFV